MPGPSEMQDIFDRAADPKGKLTSDEEKALKDATRVAGYGYGADARRAQDAYDRRKK